jgi:hypothetical protein
MGLFKPAWQSDNKEKALKVVSKETDQTRLAEIARSAPLMPVRRAAVDRLTDKAVLVDLAKSEEDFGLRSYIEKRLIYIRYKELSGNDEATVLEGILDDCKAKNWQHNGRDSDGQYDGLWYIWSAVLTRLLALYPDRTIDDCRIFTNENQRTIGLVPRLYPKSEHEIAYILICAGLIGTEYQSVEALMRGRLSVN